MPIARTRKRRFSPGVSHDSIDAPTLYRKFRGAVKDDPDGIATLSALFGARSLEDIDRDFRAWVLSQ